MRRMLLAIVVLAVIFTLSCGEDQPSTPEGWQELTSPFNVLWDVCYCLHSDTEIDTIKRFSTLLSDDYIFYFDPDDIGDQVGYYIIPTFWTKNEFMIAFNNMFCQAYSLHLDIPILEQGEDAFGRPAVGDTTFSKNNVSINFTLMVDTTNGYIAQGFCDFKFSKGSDGFWRLCEWRDHTSSLLCTSPTDLGKILALYYQP